MSARIVFINSAKGGVGKTFIVANLSTLLSRQNQKILLLDCDFHCKNLHSFFNLQTTLNREQAVESTHDVLDIKKTQFRGLSLARFNQELDYAGYRKVFVSLINQNYDWIFVDTHSWSSDFFELFHDFATDLMLVSTAERTSVEKTYRYFEELCCYELEKSCNIPDGRQKLVEFKKTYTVGGLQFKDYIKTRHSIFPYKLWIVPSQAHTHLDLHLGESLKSVIRKFYGVEISALPGIEYDNAAWHSLRNQVPLVESHPFSTLTGAIGQTTRILLRAQNHSTKFKAVV